MYSLVWLFDKVIELKETVTDLPKIFLSGIRYLFYFLDVVVYKLIIGLYDAFRWICGARIVDNSIMNELATRIGFILGLIMFFYISFDFIQIILDPDKLTDKDKGPINIIKKFIIVIVLLGTSRYIFDLLFNFQTIVLSNEDGRGSVIEKLLLPYDIDSSNFGKALSANFMAMFYQITDDDDIDALKDYADDYEYDDCYEFAAALPNTIAADGSFSIGYECLNERYRSSEGKKWYIDFNILSFPVGVFVAWVLITYCISVGVRVIYLALLQIISPATIICYLSPNKENVFTKWLKLYISTYLDVFIRIAIIDFVVLLSGLILDKGNYDSFWTSVPGDIPVGGERTIILVFMILSLLMFAKKFPELLKKLLPDSIASSGIGFGISTPKQLFDDLKSSPLTKVGTTVASPIGLLGKKTLGGIDALRHGQKFSTGWNRNKGKFGNWLDKQRETYIPYSYEQSKKRVEGVNEVSNINDQWEEGVSIAKTLMRKRGMGTYGTANGWDTAFKGTVRSNYEAVFHSKAFIDSKMNVDKESDVEDQLRRGYQQVQSGGTFSYNGQTYDVSNMSSLLEIYEKQTKKVEGLKAVHESISKQYSDDARREAAFKFVKNNEANPSKPKIKRITRKI